MNPDRREFINLHPYAGFTTALPIDNILRIEFEPKDSLRLYQVMLKFAPSPTEAEALTQDLDPQRFFISLRYQEREQSLAVKRSWASKYGKILRERLVVWVHSGYRESVEQVRSDLFYGYWPC